jgi:uncharacterized small protein (DUF1192 family)
MNPLFNKRKDYSIIDLLYQLDDYEDEIQRLKDEIEKLENQLNDK